MPGPSHANRQYRLAARPVGLPKHSDWKFTTEPVAEPADGQVLVKVLQLSLDPAMRGWMNEGQSYIPPVGIVGYCFGGTIAWLAAARAKGFTCSVPYYGGGMHGLIKEQPKIPVMCNFGEADQSPTLAQAKEIVAAHPEITAHFYPNAGHGFNCDQRGSWNADAAKLARSRTVEFFRKHLG